VPRGKEGRRIVRKTVTTVLLAWTLWWVQEIPKKPEMPQDIVKLSVHDTQAACEERAATRRQWQEDLNQQEVTSFDWKSKPWPTYMLRRQTFTCIQT
jgi:hypothetical protein